MVGLSMADMTWPSEAHAIGMGDGYRTIVAG